MQDAWHVSYNTAFHLRFQNHSTFFTDCFSLGRYKNSIAPGKRRILRQLTYLNQIEVGRFPSRRDEYYSPRSRILIFFLLQLSFFFFFSIDSVRTNDSTNNYPPIIIITIPQFFPTHSYVISLVCICISIAPIILCRNQWRSSTSWSSIIYVAASRKTLIILFFLLINKRELLVYPLHTWTSKTDSYQIYVRTFWNSISLIVNLFWFKITTDIKNIYIYIYEFQLIASRTLRYQLLLIKFTISAQIFTEVSDFQMWKNFKPVVIPFSRPWTSFSFLYLSRKYSTIKYLKKKFGKGCRTFGNIRNLCQS